MSTDMPWWTKIRLEVLRGETSKREILRREGIHWETLKLNFFVPVPPVNDLDELNCKLAQMCREDLKRRLRGKSATKAQLLAEVRNVRSKINDM